MSLSLILPMSAFALAASISPGPVNLVCLSSGTRYPVSRGLIFVTGATLGFIALFVAVGLGLYSLLTMVPMLETLLRWGGVAFLLYLSIKLAMDSGQLPEKGVDKAPGFGTGAIMQWLNPKAWLASASGIGAYTSANDLNQILLFASLYLPICWLSLACWVYAGAFLRRYVQRPAVLVTINRTLALLLAISCLYLVTG
ncbi:Threonine/homoserine/homoserine lactone efflux protein [Marinobacter salarius]|jgi:threonine/homoserine/homoserine lactone efflux protein|uniref:Threonine/homoserine/homoserine lactone efflux protein n=2 Tax=Marinobacter salarius TaxID=1420917 RepID=A0ABY1FMP1_9GAMM|nr:MULTISPECIES: LysE family translocator [Marinobacter]KXJ42380.1 MAG: lysine transporter LysE [Marinobacter sp. Hex_13]MBL84821.1 LysE family translocator [Marinobacter sp.]MBS8231436.1 LysE family translocator [Marinobacter salarius]MCZ4285587.1 LysE family translocator [Marinobacter salarius]MDC8457062.1 LysE family translocator [Marinobacter sp. DS40M6]|tara:strand:+ start:664 stop:1257 length:594 start_codon:yes stop_codon:yes gene_type:complete